MATTCTNKKLKSCFDWLRWTVNAVRYERDRIWYWKNSYSIFGRKHSWKEAMRATIENPRCFDIMWEDINKEFRNEEHKE